MTGNAKTDIRNTRLLSLGSYERGMGGRGLEAHVWPYGLLGRRAFGWKFAGQQCSVAIFVTKIVSAGEGRGTLIGIMGAVTRGDGRE